MSLFFLQEKSKSFLYIKSYNELKNNTISTISKYWCFMLLFHTNTSIKYLKEEATKLQEE